MKEALAKIALAIGDGKIVPLHAYVLHEDGRLHATNGRQFATYPGDESMPPFCIHAGAFSQALSREGARIELNAGRNVVVRYAGTRGRVTLKSVDTQAMPVASTMSPQQWQTITNGAEFLASLKILRNFCGPPDGQAWSTGIHYGPDFAFAASNKAAARFETRSLGLLQATSLPVWASDFILGQEIAPVRFADEAGALFFEWADKLALRASLITEDAPDTAWTLVSNLPRVETPLPIGLVDAVTRAIEHGISTVYIGDGVVRADLDYATFEEEVDIQTAQRPWNAPLLAGALAFATHIDFSGPHCMWNGPMLRGIVAGMASSASGG